LDNGRNFLSSHLTKISTDDAFRISSQKTERVSGVQLQFNCGIGSAPSQFFFWVFGRRFFSGTDDKLNTLLFVCANVATGSQIYGCFSEKGHRLSSHIAETFLEVNTTV